MSKTDLSYMAEITSVEPLTQNIIRVFLKPEHFIPYQAGQYLQILTAEESLYYSIANAPLGAHQYELHMRHQASHPGHRQILQDMKTQGELSLYLPLGNCHVGCLTPNKATLMIAQGTGFAPMKAIIEQWLADETFPPTVLYWLARTPEDWYIQPLVQAWETQIQALQYRPYLVDEIDSTLIQTLTNGLPFTLSETQVILAGPPDKVWRIREEMMQTHQMALSQFFSDAFESSPP